MDTNTRDILPKDTLAKTRATLHKDTLAKTRATLPKPTSRATRLTSKSHPKCLTLGVKACPLGRTTASQ